MVFTLPAAISAIAWYNKAVIYGLLFDGTRSISDTLV